MDTYEIILDGIQDLTSTEIVRKWQKLPDDKFKGDWEKAIQHVLSERGETVESITNTLGHAKDVILTTAPFLEGYRVTKTINIVSSECVFGMNVFKDIFASFTDVTGGRSGSMQKVLREAKRTCLNELKVQASNIGANAVIAIDLDYSELTGAGKAMLFLVANGTAVKVEPSEQNHPLGTVGGTIRDEVVPEILDHSTKEPVTALPENPNRPEIRIAQCAKCNKKLSYKKSMQGNDVKCPGCNQAFTLP